MRGNLAMKNKFFQLIMITTISVILSIAEASSAQAQWNPLWNPFTNLFFCPFAYCPFLPPPPSSYTGSPAALGRYAHVPLTTASLFPAPVLHTVPAATIAGVGVTSLIPTTPLAATVPASVLVTSPLAPLITFTPLSLVGLTFAPVPVLPPTVPIVI